jgi:restriction system protein
VQTWNGLVDQTGHPMRAGQAKLVRLEVGSINEALLAKVRASPDMLHALSPREFEEVVASFYEEQGWHVTLTPPSKDGGKDIIIVKKDEAGTRLCLVECKRWSPERPVGVEIVRQLYGVVERETATSGILVTTSRFTRGARQEEQALAHRMLLHDYTELTRLLGPPTGGLQ